MSAKPAAAPGAAIVIGGGFGGLAAAARLRARGYGVTLLDRCPRLGGRAQVFERDGFRHDAGPTVITAPFLFDEIFDLFGKKRQDYVTFTPLSPWYRFYFQDGSTFDYGGSVEDTLREIARIHPPDVEGYKRLLEHSRRLFEAGFVDLADAPFHDFWTMLKQAPRLAELESYRSVWSLIAKHLKHEKIRQALSIQPLLVGGSPFATTSIYGLIHYLERRWGVWFAMGGTGAIVDALERLLLEQGVAIRTRTTVERVLVENGRAVGVALEGGETLGADIVVSNVDPLHLYAKMLPQAGQNVAVRLKRGAARLSMGLFVLYFGTRRTYPDVAHHTIWMGPRFKELLADIFDRGVLAEDFSLYLHRPTATDSSFAPPGCDSFYVLAPVPNLTHDIDWAVEGPKLRDRIVAALDRTLLPGLADTITADFFMTPENFASDYLSVSGTGFLIAPHFTQSAWFRFHNRAEGVENLYLVGAGAHPGAGMPGVLASARVLEQLLSPPGPRLRDTLGRDASPVLA